VRAQEEVEAAVAHLKQELKRPPTEAEIAGEVGIEVAEYQDFLNQYSRAHFVSLEANDRTGVEYRELIKDPAALGPPPSLRSTPATCAPSESRP
jgi:DNA-directed RNA polymerase specialized sigma subunit